MYNTLRDEMAYRRVKVTDIANLIGRTVSTTSQKMNGYAERELDDFTFGEAVKIYERLDEIKPLNMSIKDLFKNSPEAVV